MTGVENNTGAQCPLHLCIYRGGQLFRTVFESGYLGNFSSQKLFATLIGKLPISGMT
jgi:hypothetical protein